MDQSGGQDVDQAVSKDLNQTLKEDMLFHRIIFVPIVFLFSESFVATISC